MARYVMCVLLFRILLPLCMATCVIFRPSLLSGIYLLIMCYLPFVPLPTESSMSGHTGIFLKILVTISVLTALAQVTFQVVLLLMPPYGGFIEDNSILEKALRHAGFVRLNNISAGDATIWLFPEVLMLAISLSFFVTLKKLTKPPPNVLDQDSSAVLVRKSKYSMNFLVVLGKFCVLTLLCVAGVLRPSVLGALYYLVFLSCATWWACNKRLSKGFAVTLCCLLPIIFVHLSLLFVYQFEWPQEFLDANSTYARYFGLTQLTVYNNTTNNSTASDNATALEDIRHFEWVTTEWVSYINPIFLYYLFYVAVLEAKELFDPELQKKQGPFTRLDSGLPGKLGRQMSQRLSKQKLIRTSTPKKRWQSATRKVRENISEAKSQNPKEQPGEKTPLIRGVSPSKKSGSGKKSGLLQDSTGSVTVTGNTEDIPMDEFDDDEDYEPSLLENVLYALESILQLIVRSSYIGTNIIMMAWSITYLSWITFVLLIWANLIWLLPKQRKSMLSSSPFLVIYAWFLLLSAYVYSMNLTEDELPSSMKDVNFAEIGFVKVTSFPCAPLFVKTLYTVMFWVTLRQYTQERLEERQTSALADMVAPLQVTVGAAAGVNREQEKAGSKIMQKIGNLLKKFLTKTWIWVVAITLFGVAITGQRMTGFRILYMALFLMFIVTFQFSFRIWRKMMFAFWLTVIIYSMIILVLVYTYQFENFPRYWTEYLKIPKEIQLDIGLEQFQTKQLFVRLVTPTFFVIITVIQVHYFHHDFMELSNPKNVVLKANPVEDLEQSSLQGGADIERSIKDEPSSSLQFDLYDIDNFTSDRFKLFLRNTLYVLHQVKNLTYRFLELHMLKVVLFFAMLMCVYDKCALYIVIIIFISLACTFGRPMQIFAVYTSSLLISVLLLARMIYQIQYITPGNWNVTCTVNADPNVTEIVRNNAHWLGFQKETEANRSLPSLVKWNIIYILIVTLWSVILVRQYNHRLSRGRPTTRAFFMFPSITRPDADKDLKSFIKYTLNYGYYKVGVEVTFIMIVALIGMRLDMYAVMHAVWLCILISLHRKTLARIWIFYLMFVAFSLPFHYFMAVGLLPTLCIEYPWDKGGVTMQSLQDWAFLMDNYHPPAVKKLLCDFFLLMFVYRQWVVFRIENRYPQGNYSGGSNDSIIHHAEQKDFNNPVPDFITYVRSYVDIMKKCVLQSFLWFTLALVFLAGTNRINIFSLGYLLFAFVFLWQGSDFYLRPIPKILKQWQFLISYNVVVILIKTSFQLLGCVFIDSLPTNFCWIIQLLGIGCLRKFDSGDFIPKPEEDSDHCYAPDEYVGIVWDGICFGFLIFQRRIFRSYNFFHIVDDTKATTILASRGAELIEEMRHKTMKEQEEEEHRILEKIRLKMDRIKANQQKIQDSILRGKPKYKWEPPITSKQAIRSGDYYMFDELEDEDIDLLPHENADEDDDDEPMKPDVGQIGEEYEPRSVRILELPEEDEPQPGTSKDGDYSELTEPKETVGKKFLRWFLFLWAFVESAMVSLTKFLNKYSRNYRYVLRVLAKEKRILKEKTNYSIGLRMGPGQIWQPAGSYHSLLRQSMKTSSAGMPHESEYEEMSSYDQPTIFRLTLAVWYIIMSRSEFLCYFVIFLNQVKTATFLSLPLPLMVFFWGSLTIPRPSKTFWVTIIAYTEVIVLLKCLFQFDMMPGNTANARIGLVYSSQETNIMYPPNLFGLHRQDNYATWDLLLLLVVFFHRVLLKSMGIWSNTAPTTAVLLDGEYRLEDGQLVPVSTSSSERDTPGSKGKRTMASPMSSAKSGSSGQSRRTIQGEIYVVKTKRFLPIDHLKTAMRMTIEKYAEAFRLFNQQLLDPTSRVAADVYFIMFFCDFFNFFVLLFGYSSFGSQQDGGVQAYLEDNRVPPLFLFMLILQFMLIIIDRGIYLRKNIFAKIIFQYVQIILLHVWLFAIFPVITGSICNTVVPPQIYYLVKCFYLLLSAFQIRCGYPTRILGNFLCKGYGHVNMFLFRVFMLIPFLFELRTCMDWMWTETSMTIFDWIKMEDIFQHIYLLKCSRHVEDEYPQPRGEKKKSWIKYLMGGSILVAIIAIIWFPLVFFSLGNAVGQPNIPYEVTLEIRIGPYEPIYKMSAQSNSIFQFNERDFSVLQSQYNAHKVSETFIYNYEASDVAAAKLNTDSANIWSISPPDRERMLEEINSTKTLAVTLDYGVSHKTSKAEDAGVMHNQITIYIPPSSNVSREPARDDLLKMLQGQTADPVLFEYILPKFLKVTNRGTAMPISDLMIEKPDVRAKEFRNVTITLHYSNGSSAVDKEWWTVHEECDDKNYHEFLAGMPYEDCAKSLIVYTFNDKIFPPSLNLITGGGIIGLYTTLVFLASRFLRGFFADQCSKIMFEDMPYVDRVLQLCFDVYLVREASEFTLEEDLFAKLVFLFRSPETLIKWTRPREELMDNDDPEGDGE